MPDVSTSFIGRSKLLEALAARKVTVEDQEGCLGFVGTQSFRRSLVRGHGVSSIDLPIRVNKPRE